MSAHPATPLPPAPFWRHPRRGARTGPTPMRALIRRWRRSRCSHHRSPDALGQPSPDRPSSPAACKTPTAAARRLACCHLWRGAAPASGERCSTRECHGASAGDPQSENSIEHALLGLGCASACRICPVSTPYSRW